MARCKVPFDVVALEVGKLFLCNDVFTAMESYFELLETFGWSIVEYEKELLSKIDREWITLHREQCLSN